MIRKFWMLVTIPILLLFSGCAFVNLSLLPESQSMKEQEIEGKGTAKILLLDITGTISEKSQEPMLMGAARPSMVARVREALQKAEQDKAIAGVILRINSPGGTTTASDIIHHEIIGFKARKNVPVYACITGVGASGGYYVAAAADNITAHPTAVTGSIGVIMMTINVEGLMQKIGVNEITIKSGDKKDMMSPFRTATPEEKQIVQTVVNQMQNRFVDIVMARPGNTLSRKELETLADGRIYTAEQALAAKLIDRVGYLDDTIIRMKDKIGAKEARVVTYLQPGQHRGSIYSASPAPSSGFTGALTGGVNMDQLGETQFMYLWKPF